MFCQNCGHEIYSDANFCPKCGRQQNPNATSVVPPLDAPQAQSSGSVPAPAPPKARWLWNLHTFDWSGECPVCHLAHTHETAACPNDGSPLVVAFESGRWNPFAFPMHTAHLRCLNNCGFTSSATTCSRDGSIITGRFIRFRVPMWRAAIYNLIKLLALFLWMLPLVPFFCGIYEYWTLRFGGDTSLAFVHTGVGFVFMLLTLPILKHHNRSWWWKFRTSLDFERAGRR